VGQLRSLSTRKAEAAAAGIEAELRLRITPGGVIAPAPSTVFSRHDVVSKREAPELRIGWWEVYGPQDLDTHGEFMRAEEVRKMGHSFIGRLVLKGHFGIDVDHDRKPGRAVPVESFIARPGDPDFTPFWWVLGIHFLDVRLWDSVRKGEHASLSFQGRVMLNEVDMLVDAATTKVGSTTMVADHTHSFEVQLDDTGSVIGGRTSTEQGHSHPITENVRTGMVNGHRHGFALPRFVEAA